MAVELALISSLEGIYDCERLQKEIWGFSDLSIIPHHVVLTTIHAGGLLVGAYDIDRLIGFAYSTPGLFYPPGVKAPDGFVLRHCSLMAAVHPEYQSQGIGHLLKAKQLEYVQQQKIDLITWTFDPLQSLNAHFNFHKLGAICRKYVPDLYGDMRDELNKGLPTDRFVAEWWINSERVRLSLQHKQNPQQRALDFNSIPQINETNSSNGILESGPVDLARDESLLKLEIPDSLALVKERSVDLALDWRLKTREIFNHYLNQGYVIVDLLVQKSSNGRCVFYLLENQPLEAVLNRDHED